MLALTSQPGTKEREDLAYIAYTWAWTIRVNQRMMLDTEVLEFIGQDRDAAHDVAVKCL
jgi:hypothetical protein